MVPPPLERHGGEVERTKRGTKDLRKGRSTQKGKETTKSNSVHEETYAETVTESDNSESGLICLIPEYDTENEDGGFTCVREHRGDQGTNGMEFIKDKHMTYQPHETTKHQADELFEKVQKAYGILADMVLSGTGTMPPKKGEQPIIPN